ncbi:MAG TPA: hypothetical protein VNH44_16225 [Micropepsaceae bacterium]|nr:hypothetical protein [Micropepsaceae bacterium]
MTDDKSKSFTWLTFPAFLGREAGDLVGDTAEWLRYDPDSPKAREAAVRSARLAIPKLLARTDAPAGAAEAFAVICAALEKAERDIRNTPRPKKTGKRAAREDREFQGRAVLAVEWLTQLKEAPMTLNAARATVAPLIPDRMLTYRGKKYSGDVRLAAWHDAFSQARADRNPENQRILHALRFERDDAWRRSWREPLVDYRGVAVRDMDGMIVYSDEWFERDETDASPADVLAWLKGKKDKS